MNTNLPNHKPNEVLICCCCIEVLIKMVQLSVRACVPAALLFTLRSVLYPRGTIRRLWPDSVRSARVMLHEQAAVCQPNELGLCWWTIPVLSDSPSWHFWADTVPTPWKPAWDTVRGERCMAALVCLYLCGLLYCRRLNYFNKKKVFWWNKSHTAAMKVKKRDWWRTQWGKKCIFCCVIVKTVLGEQEWQRRCEITTEEVRLAKNRAHCKPGQGVTMLENVIWAFSLSSCCCLCNQNKGFLS